MTTEQPRPEQEPEYIMDAVRSRPYSPLTHVEELNRLYKEAYDNSYTEALDDNAQLEDEPQVVIGMQKLGEIIRSHLSEKEIFAYGLDCSQGADCKTCKEDPEKCGMRMRDGSPASFKPLAQDTTGQEKPDCEGKCCPSGIVQGKEVLCRAESYMCEYQCPIDGAIPKLVCIRDSVEQEKTQAPATGRDSLDTLRDWVLDRCSSGAFFTLWEINHKINEIRSRPHLISPRDKSHSPCLHYGVCRLIHGNTCLLDDGEDCNHVLISPLTQDTTPIFEKLQHPTIHVVKSWTRYFNAMQDGSKKFDKRVWDRDYQVGDTLIQEEWNKDGGYTGKSVGHVITYILTGEFAEPGICVMSVDGVEFETRKERDEKIRQDEREKANKIFDHTRALCDAIIERFDCQSKLGFNALIIKRDIESLRACSAVCRGGVR